MFGWWPRLPVDFAFPTVGSNEAPMREASVKCVDMYIASVRDRLRTALQEAQAQPTAEACWQKQYYDRKIGAVNLKPGDLVLVKVDAWKGKRKINNRWEEETWEVVHQIAADVLSYEVTNQCRWSWVLHQNWLLLIMSEIGIPLCMGSHTTQDRCTSPTPCMATPISLGPDEDRRTCWKLVSLNILSPVNEKTQDYIWKNRMRNLHSQFYLMLSTCILISVM